jgi:uncharacterized protein (TIGR00255 family)
MIKSMTGYGRGEEKLDGIEITTEMKSVNHRYLDFFIRVPRQMSFLEEKIRAYVSKKISRGKIDIFVTCENFGSDSRSVLLDEELVKSYISAMTKLRDDYKLIDDISTSIIARFPDVLKVEKIDEDEIKVWNVVEKALSISIAKMIEMRINEGKKLKESILEKLKSVEKSLNIIKGRAPLVVENYKERLNARLGDILNQEIIDENRLAAELMIFSDKCSIDEEVVRMDSHIIQVNKILGLDYPIGRKLDFMVQEMNREINTIGAKANDLVITNNVVDVKSELEKIREQIQNIE